MARHGGKVWKVRVLDAEESHECCLQWKVDCVLGWLEVSGTETKEDDGRWIGVGLG